MSNLNSDVLYLIFEEIQDDKNTLYSCLLVNKPWCETTVPILWKNPWKNLKEKNEKLLSKVIISHLSNVSRNKIREYKLLTNFYKKLSFNYIRYCRHLNLDIVQRIIINNNDIYEKDKNLNVQNEVLNLLINENMKYTHLYIYQNFDSQIHLTHEAKRCFSEIEFLSCSTGIKDNIISILTETCKSIKKLELFIKLVDNNYGIVKFIEAQTKLFDVGLIRTFYYDGTFYEILENSLIKHASTIQYFKITRRPSTNILSSFINLKELELTCAAQCVASLNYLENLSFPFLQVLKSNNIPIEALTSLIMNTKGFLVEIKLDYIRNDRHDEISNKKLIQVIYQNCPNIKYLKLIISNCGILEFETLLIRCKYLKVLYLIIDDNQFDWNKLFEILSKSSSTSLFKFKLYSDSLPKLESFKLFFDNWKGRHPMFLQIFSDPVSIDSRMIERYKEEGIIKKFDCMHWRRKRNEGFDWT
ncbi:hypothetical protein RhiirA5_426302 [Rhizophagus irregularis]|uniref:F-box domain-containing protein n=2 Tax=Rhizophagus irregularis TaxID=588596 RepID=A0A2I1EXL8_9GLOM|nr:hypothetical protein RhiirA5_426302 [Rhizophagus irregularis]PKC58587.1 hypothetical protein RhiirA1_470738 [Rhizophagus irregularis]PKY26870.1 hypothetical protein RhiirB3_442344 [Rhizophagus irregularis]